MKLIGWCVTSRSIREVTRPHHVAFGVSSFRYEPINRWFESVASGSEKREWHASPIAGPILSRIKLFHEFLGDIARESKFICSSDCTTNKQLHFAFWLISPFFVSLLAFIFSVFCSFVQPSRGSRSIPIGINPNESIQPHAYHAVAVSFSPDRLSRTGVLVTTLANRAKVMLRLVENYFEGATLKLSLCKVELNLVRCFHNVTQNIETGTSIIRTIQHDTTPHRSAPCN